MMKPNITPVGTFQRITSTAPLRAETREAIQNTVLQFYIQNSQPEDDAEGLTACCVSSWNRSGCPKPTRPTNSRSG